MHLQNEAVSRRFAPAGFPAALLWIAFMLGMGVQPALAGNAATESLFRTPVTTSAPAPLPAVAASATNQDEARVVVQNGVVKFYFAIGKTDLPSDALAALGDAIGAAQTGKGLVISGFHDATGAPELNAELTRSRALSVRDALVSAGVPPRSIELRQTKQSVATSDKAEARRVEVTIAR